MAESDSAQAMPPSATPRAAESPSCSRRAHQRAKPARQALRPLLHQPAQHQHRAHAAHIQQRRQAEQQRRQQARAQPCQQLTAMETRAPHEPAAACRRPRAAPPSRPPRRPRRADLRPAPGPASAGERSAAGRPIPRPPLSESPACPCAAPDAHAWPWPRQWRPAPWPPGRSGSESPSNCPAPASARDCPRGSPSPARRAAPLPPAAAAPSGVGSCAGSFISNRSVARLPGASRPVRSSAAREIMTRGPIPAPALIRSGSCLSTAAILKLLSAQPQRLAYMRIQPNQKLLRHHGRVALQSLLQAHRRFQLGGSVVGILAGIDGLQRNQQRHRIGRHRSHGDGLRDPGECRSPARILFQTRDLVFFVSRRSCERCARSNPRPSATGLPRIACF